MVHPKKRCAWGWPPPGTPFFRETCGATIVSIRPAGPESEPQNRARRRSGR